MKVTTITEACAVYVKLHERIKSGVGLKDDALVFPYAMMVGRLGPGDLELLGKLVGGASPTPTPTPSPLPKSAAVQAVAEIRRKRQEKRESRGKPPQRPKPTVETRERVSEGRRAVARGDRPTLKEAIQEVLGKSTLGAGEVLTRLTQRGWAPNSTDPQQYISYMLSSNNDVFDRVSRGLYRVKAPKVEPKVVGNPFTDDGEIQELGGKAFSDKDMPLTNPFADPTPEEEVQWALRSGWATAPQVAQKAKLEVSVAKNHLDDLTKRGIATVRRHQKQVQWKLAAPPTTAN